jgi:C-terminal processing protease CtpA/Prc
VVVTASDVPTVQPGDIAVSIDGVPAAEALADQDAFVSGSPQWKRNKALFILGYGKVGTSAQLVLERDGTTSAVALERRSEMPPEEERPPQISELEPGIWYVNLDTAPWPDIQKNLEAIAGAKGVVFDLRGYPKGNHQVISHLLTEPDTSSAWMRTPQVTYPDFELVTWEHAGWGMKPLEPHIEGKVAFITNGWAISYAESFMSFIEGYRLAEIVGQPTAGTNGNVNTFRLPGGYSVRFTGMLVVKHDGSQHHLIGIQPTVPAERSLEGVREGRDELLEVALELVR